jgi:hypothetical protein
MKKQLDVVNSADDTAQTNPFGANFECLAKTRNQCAADITGAILGLKVLCQEN